MSRRFSTDVSVQSNNGRYRLEARSPANGVAQKPEERGQFDWRYQLFDGDKLSWEDWYSVKQMHPSSIWLSDKGRAIVEAFAFPHEHITTISTDGRQTSRLYLSSCHEQPSQEPWYRHRYMRNSTAGLVWREGSIDCLFSFGQHEYFTITTVWGDSLVCNLERGVWLDEVSDDFRTTLKAEEEHECLRRLSSDDPLVVFNALARIVRTPFFAAREMLLGVETQEEYPEKETRNSLDHNAYSYVASAHGWILRLALRRCGILPSAKPAYGFIIDGVLSFPDITPDLAREPGALKAMDKWQDAIRELGAPDNIRHLVASGKPLRTAEVWEYYHGLDEQIRATRLLWEPGTDGRKLKSAQVVAVSPENIVDYLIDAWWETPIKLEEV